MKFLAPIALAFAAATASAAGPAVTLGYDYDHATSTRFSGTHELRLGVAQETPVGTFDGAFIGQRRRGEAFTDGANGFEVGYSNGLPLGTVGLKGRVAYGRLNQVDPNGGGFLGNQQYVSLGAEAALPVTSVVNAFGGYEYRHPLRDATPNRNRYTVGVDYAVTKDVSLRAGYARTQQAGIGYNGLTTALSYQF